MKRIVLAISGASGLVLGFKTLKRLTGLKCHVELVITPAAFTALLQEMGREFTSAAKMVAALPAKERALVRVHKINDMCSPTASGSFQTDGMIVIPCSMASLAAISIGLSDNLLRRAADVTIKEKRPLVIVPREAPLSVIHLENMLKLAKLGVIIHPPLPSWYLRPKSIDELEDQIVDRCLDPFKIPHHTHAVWAAC